MKANQSLIDRLYRILELTTTPCTFQIRTHQTCLEVTTDASMSHGGVASVDGFRVASVKFDGKLFQQVGITPQLIRTDKIPIANLEMAVVAVAVRHCPPNCDLVVHCDNQVSLATIQKDDCKD